VLPLLRTQYGLGAEPAAGLVARSGDGIPGEALLRITNHSAINANGTITVAFDTFTAECLPTEP
jgi:hypothetical protein